jgi:multidrug efflux pump subunit AcrA (membrane-fusion protein)
MNSFMKIIPIRKILPWLIVATLAALAIYRLRFSPVPVIAHTLASGEVQGDVMGTGTLEARVKTTIRPRIQERLAEVLVDQDDIAEADCQVVLDWTVGQRAEVFIQTEHKSGVLAMPQRFVQWRDGISRVFVNERGRAKWREITLALRGRDAVEVTHGLKTGEHVVAPREAGQTSLTDGQNIHAP